LGRHGASDAAHQIGDRGNLQYQQTTTNSDRVIGGHRRLGQLSILGRHGASDAAHQKGDRGHLQHPKSNELGYGYRGIGGSAKFLFWAATAPATPLTK